MFVSFPGPSKPGGHVYRPPRARSFVRVDARGGAPAIQGGIPGVNFGREPQKNRWRTGPRSGGEQPEINQQAHRIDIETVIDNGIYTDHFSGPSQMRTRFKRQQKTRYLKARHSLGMVLQSLFSVPAPVDRRVPNRVGCAAHRGREITRESWSAELNIDATRAGLG